jgi:hypothetical protein
MKRVFVLTVALLYLVITSGVVVNVHYCMGRIAEVAFHEVNNDACGTCGMDNSGCCHNDQQVFKLTDSHKAPSIVEVKDKFAFAKAKSLAFYEYQFILPARVQETTIAERGPPLNSAIAKNILFCVFRI